MIKISHSCSWTRKVKAEPKPRITFIGCGNMGQALLKRWKDHENYTFAVIKPTPLPASFKNIHHDSALNAEILQNSVLIILAVKPQMMTDICATLKPLITAQTPILSIAAGYTLSKLAHNLHPDQPITRAMPNTPSEIGQGANICVANTHTSDETKRTVSDLFALSGLLEWLDHEDLIDQVTALAASGPAYLYYFTQSLTNAAIKTGLPESLAQSLAKQTIIGAAALMENSTKSPQELRQNVTSKAGVTEAALNILINGNLESLLHDALKANINRAKDLEKE